MAANRSIGLRKNGEQITAGMDFAAVSNSHAEPPESNHAENYKQIIATEHR